MDKEIMMELMKQAISDVLETMFFQPVQISSKNYTLQEWFFDKQSLLGATLTFSGPFAGLFYIVIPVNLVKEITANFLGIEKEEVNENQKKDTIKEALNIIGGHMFSLFDKEDATSLGIPELIEENNLKHDNLGEIKGNTFFIKTEDNHRAALVVTEMK
jgi:hypothetical protein